MKGLRLLSTILITITINFPIKFTLQIFKYANLEQHFSGLEDSILNEIIHDS